MYIKKCSNSEQYYLLKRYISSKNSILELRLYILLLLNILFILKDSLLILIYERDIKLNNISPLSYFLNFPNISLLDIEILENSQVINGGNV
ncbi:TPA: hypothetical protein JI077_05745 [Acinetobacter baumannii]|nr:hypothetical protein [Acinetobacter baumannii]